MSNGKPVNASNTETLHGLAGFQFPVSRFRFDILLIL
jgi:hypothetical protein